MMHRSFQIFVQDENAGERADFIMSVEMPDDIFAAMTEDVVRTVFSQAQKSIVYQLTRERMKRWDDPESTVVPRIPA
jgi:hypothetical protein